MLKRFPHSLEGLIKKRNFILKKMREWDKKYSFKKSDDPAGSWSKKLLRDANKPYCYFDFLNIECKIKKLQ